VFGKSLETRIPPPIVTAAMLGLLWGAHRAGVGRIAVQFPLWLPSILIGMALLLMLLAVMQMFRARTTVNPLDPRRSEHLVTKGIFAFSRNPIYLGDALIVAAAGFLMPNWVALAALAFFVLYITRFQIFPEEQALKEKFGLAFDEYCAATRRWV
jgi:protein-S-isoprenylcysteine O-methyltransferase Ste14